MTASMESRSYLPPEEPLTRTSTLAIVSMVMGILSWSALPLICGIAAVITGHMARMEIARSAGRITGDGFAVTGLITGYANIAIIALLGLCISGFFLISVAGVYLSQ